MKMLEVSQLRKKCPTFALGPIDLELEAGSMNGLIGPNAGGKSTLYRCIIGTVRRDAGRIRVGGAGANERSGKWRNDVGYVGDFTPLFDHLTGAANLSLFSRFYDNWSDQLAESLVARLSLDLSIKARNCSTGQRARLAVVIALAHRPRLLFLDDPATRYLGRLGFDLNLETADAWQVPDVGDEFRRPVETRIPVVFLRGDGDTSTPIENTLALTPYCPDSRVLIVHRGGHGGVMPVAANHLLVMQQLRTFLQTGETDGLPLEVAMPARRFALPDYSLPTVPN